MLSALGSKRWPDSPTLTTKVTLYSFRLVCMKLEMELVDFLLCVVGRPVMGLNLTIGCFVPLLIPDDPCAR